MPTLTWFLVESPLVLGAALFVINFAMLVHWRRGGRPRPLLIALLASFTLLNVSFLVETRDEAAKRILDAIARDVRLGRVDALDRALSADFEAPPLDRSAFLDRVRDELRVTKVLWSQRTHFARSQNEDERFLAEVTYFSQLVANDFTGSLKTRWQIGFRWINGAWRIETISPPMVDGHAFRDWASTR